MWKRILLSVLFAGCIALTGCGENGDTWKIKMSKKKTKVPRRTKIPVPENATKPTTYIKEKDTENTEHEN